MSRKWDPIAPVVVTLNIEAERHDAALIADRLAQIGRQLAGEWGESIGPTTTHAREEVAQD